jgi:hypothetical protein
MGSRSFKAFALDELVWNWILAAFENPEVIREAFERWKSNQEEGRSFEYDRLESILKARDAADNYWKNCMTSAAEAKDEMTRAHFTKMADDAAADVKAQTEAYEKLAVILERADVRIEQIEDVIALGSQARDKLLEADYQDKRTFLYGFGVVLQIKSLTDYHIGWRLDHLETLADPNRW